MTEKMTDGWMTGAVWLFVVLILLNLLLSLGIVFFKRHDPRAVWTWLLALNFLPVFGFFLYLLLEQDFQKSRMFRIKEGEDRLCDLQTKQEKWQKSREQELIAALDPQYALLARYNLDVSGAVLTVNNEVDIFTDGEKKIQDLKQELQHAVSYIHLQYYIIRNDEVFDALVPVLLEKAKAGVEVRILYDGMGSRFMPDRRWNELEAAGIRTASFFPPVLGRLNFRLNYRNHRKIVVIDGRVGYVGGFNIGREYLSRDKKFGHWRDTHLKLRGEAVIGLGIRFAQDWKYAAGENLFQKPEYFQEKTEALFRGKTERRLGIQIISSGPDMHSRQIRDNYLTLIHQARHHIYIQTPYFVPDDTVLSALQIAAHSGVDVRLMIPCKPDHPFVYWAGYSYLGDLLQAGARCYTYENGFLHAKLVTADGCVGCCGSANLDQRSFCLNFEVNAVIYDRQTTGRLEQTFLEDLECCREVTRESYALRGVSVRFREQCCRLLSPLL